MYILTLFCFLPLSEAYHNYKYNHRNDVFSDTANEWLADLRTAIKTDTIHLLAVKLFSNDFLLYDRLR